ncbi:hypothetical protein [Virgibacillus alimentarius]|uniref:Uncharacterized protein n=1 Tax=Virgibacillus alimentarius TaxID=698769 RepID=A0ABS4S842_9BACI|nr:hypothetical protein [Virgibacillus alimentarius]MBP2257661.1 hypothetical protein [Virgibacillus alimentarius]
MGVTILQVVFLCGIIYGFLSFFLEMKNKSKKDKNQLMLSISVVVASTASFLLLLN